MYRDFCIDLLMPIANSCALHAQAPNAVVIEAKFQWRVVRDDLLNMAEKMPAVDCGFKPSIETLFARVSSGSNRNLGPAPMRVQRPS